MNCLGTFSKTALSLVHVEKCIRNAYNILWQGKYQCTKFAAILFFSNFPGPVLKIIKKQGLQHSAESNETLFLRLLFFEL